MHDKAQEIEAAGQRRAARAGHHKELFDVPPPEPARARITGVVDWAGTSWGPADLDVAHCSTNLAMLHGPAWGLRFAEADEQAGGVLAASASEWLYWLVRDGAVGRSVGEQQLSKTLNHAWQTLMHDTRPGGSDRRSYKTRQQAHASKSAGRRHMISQGTNAAVGPTSGRPRLGTSPGVAIFAQDSGSMKAHCYRTGRSRRCRTAFLSYHA